MSSILHVVGKISDESRVTHQIVNTSNRKYPSADDIKNNNANILGIDPSELYVYSSTDQTEIDRVEARHEYELVWASNEITGISFSPEDNKPYLYFSIDKNFIAADGIEQVIISAEARQASDSSTVDTTINGDELSIPISSPDNPFGLMKFTFIQGKSSRAINTTISGKWIIGRETVENCRNLNSVTFNSVL